VAESPSPRHTDVPSSAPSPTHHGLGQPALHPRVYDRVFPPPPPPTHHGLGQPRCIRVCTTGCSLRYSVQRASDAHLAEHRRLFRVRHTDL
jgi:hypothetical protein